MSTLVESPTVTLRLLPRTKPVAEVDPDAVIVSTPDCALTYGELDRWSNRLARLLLTLGAGAGTPIALAISAQIESVVAERAVVKIGGTPMPLQQGERAAFGAPMGVTTKDRRPELSDEIDWLVLDERSTLQRYLAGSDAPLTANELITFVHAA